MKRLAIVLLVLASSPAFAITLLWQPPTKDADGKPLPVGLAFVYQLYGSRCGAPMKPLELPVTATKQERNPDAGCHQYAVAAAIIDSATGNPGEFGAQTPPQTVTVPATPPPPPPPPKKPGPPVGLVITTTPAE